MTALDSRMVDRVARLLGARRARAAAEQRRAGAHPSVDRVTPPAPAGLTHSGQVRERLPAIRSPTGGTQ